MANQHRVVFIRVELAVGFKYQFVAIKHGAAAQLDGRIEAGGLRCDDTDGMRIGGMHCLSIKLVRPHYIRIHTQGTRATRR